MQPAKPLVLCSQCGVALTDAHALTHLRAVVGGLEGVYCSPSIPIKKLNNAKRAHATHLPFDEAVLVLYDGPSLGMLGSAFLITTKRVCWRDRIGVTRFVEWKAVDAELVRADGRELVIGDARLTIHFRRGDEAMERWVHAAQLLASSVETMAPPAPQPRRSVLPAVKTAVESEVWDEADTEPLPAPSHSRLATPPSESASIERLPQAPFEAGAACRAVAVHPGGRHFAAAVGNAIEIRSAENCTLSFSLSTSDDVGCLAFSADGRWLLAGAADHRAYLFDATNGQHVGTTRALSDACEEVAWLGASGRFLVASHTGESAIFDAGTMTPVRPLLPPDPDYATLGGIAVTADGSRVFATVGSRMGVFDTVTGQLLWGFDRAHARPPRLATTPGGETIVSAGLDGVGIFDGPSGRVRGRYAFAGYEGVSWPDLDDTMLDELLGGSQPSTHHWMPRPRCSPGGDTVAVQDLAGNLVFIDVATGTPYPTARDRGRAWIHDLAWFPDNNSIVLGMSDGSVAVWSVRPMNLLIHCRVLEPNGGHDDIDAAG